jgi:hypothetical protein
MALLVAHYQSSTFADVFAAFRQAQHVFTFYQLILKDFTQLGGNSVPVVAHGSSAN